MSHFTMNPYKVGFIILSFWTKAVAQKLFPGHSGFWQIDEWLASCRAQIQMGNFWLLSWLLIRGSFCCLCRERCCARAQKDLHHACFVENVKFHGGNTIISQAQEQHLVCYTQPVYLLNNGWMNMISWNSQLLTVMLLFCKGQEAGPRSLDFFPPQR